MAFFDDVPLQPPDAILGLNIAFQSDKSSKKVNLGVGAYRDEDGKPWVLPCVQQAEGEIVNKLKLNKEYIPQDGTKEFKDLAVKVMYGDDTDCLSRLATSQSLSGTGGLRLGLEFLKRFYKDDLTLYLSNPTWGNHNGIAIGTGIKDIRKYSYITPEMSLDLPGMLKDLRNAPKGAVVILHLCAHNPTGVDPSHEEWKQIFQVVKERELLPFFDNAYQGFASGDPDNDAFAIRYFVSQGYQVMGSQSFAKNFGLYGERVGVVSILCSSPEKAENVRTQLKLIVRRLYSSPPLHGARIITHVLQNDNLCKSWKQDMKLMANRIKQMREALKSALEKRNTPGKWDHIVNQIGMFTFTGLSQKQVERMIQNHHIYMLKNGRISMAGLNFNNLEYVADAIHDCVTSVDSNL